MKSRSMLAFQVGVARLLETTLERYLAPWSEQPELISYENVESLIRKRADELDEQIAADWIDLSTILSLMEKRREILGKASLWPMLFTKHYTHALDVAYWSLKSVEVEARKEHHRNSLLKLLAQRELPAPLEILFH